MFYLMDAVPGPRPGRRRDARPEPEEARGDLRFDERRVARLHKVDPQRSDLGDYGRSGQYIARQVARWSRQYAELKTEDIPAMDKLSAWLPEHIPAPDPELGDPTTIVHGDYRLGNLIVHPTEPRMAVLDWELRPSATRCATSPTTAWATTSPTAARLRQGRLREAGPADRDGIRRRLLPARRPQVHPELELLPRFLAVPAGRHRPGRLPPRPAGQFVQS